MILQTSNNWPQISILRYLFSAVVLLNLFLWMIGAAHAQRRSGVYGVVVDSSGGIVVSGEGLFASGFNADTLDGRGFGGKGFTVKFNEFGQYQWDIPEGVESLANGIALGMNNSILSVPVEYRIFTNFGGIYSVNRISTAGDNSVVDNLTRGPYWHADIAADKNGICVTADLQGGSEGRYRIFNSRYSPSGQQKWEKEHETPNNGRGWGAPLTTVAMLEDGCVFASQFVDSMTFVTSVLPLTIYDYEPIVNRGRWFITRTDAFGYATTVTLLDPGVFFIWEMISDAKSNIYIAGSYSSDGVIFKTSGDPITLSQPYEHNAFLAMVDSVDNTVWAIDLGGDSFDALYGVASDSQGNLLVTGASREDIPGDPFPSESAFLSKISSSGQLIWNRRILPMTGSRIAGHGVATGPDDEVVVVGTMAGLSTDIESGLVVDGRIAFIAKYDSDGAIDWSVGAHHVVSVEEEIVQTQNTFDGPYPNPFSDTVSWRIQSGRIEHINLKVFNVLGQLVLSKQILSDVLQDGVFKIEFGHLKPGVYLYQFSTRAKIQTGSMVSY